MGLDIDGERANDFSGYSVAMSSDGSRVAIGALHNDGNGTSNSGGHVRVYDENGGMWEQVGLDIDGERENDYSGFSVAMSSDGSRIAIGSPYNDGNGTSDSGHMRVYTENGGRWEQVGSDIDGESANDLSGYSVAMSSDGSRVAIGAVYNDGNGANSGHVRVYTENGGRWEQVGLDIDGERANDYSGFPVAMSSDGSRVAIGAIYNDGNGANSGHVRVYHHNEGMAWETIGSDIRGESAGDNSGRSVAMSSDGSRVAIGAPYNDGNGTSDSGHVRVYDLLTAPPPSPPPPSRPPAFPGGRYVEGTVHCEGGVWPSELSWTMECESPEGDPRLSLQGGAPYNKTWTILPPANCTLSMFDSFGDGWGEGEWSGFGNGPYKVPADNATWSETFTVWPPT